MTTETIEKIELDEKVEKNTDEKVDKNTDEPGKYNVIFLNDNHTPMEFVTELLIIIFKHSQETAEKIMLTVHEKGSSVVGTYTYEIAEQKMTEATLCARQQGFPLGIQIERV